MRAAAWLPLVAGLEAGARLAAEARPAHFRRQRPAWEAAAEALGEERYTRVGGRLARWRRNDPSLPLVRELLWAVEQPEAYGFTRLALAGTSALALMVPADDLRAGYVVGQSARAVRTLGDPAGAIERYITARSLAERNRDTHLQARVALGTGTTYLHRGNTPAARAAFQSVLDIGVRNPMLLSVARIGLVSTAERAKDWDTALHHGWYLLRARTTNAMHSVDVLCSLAHVCERIGRYATAEHAASIAARAAVRPDQRMIANCVLLAVATARGDWESGAKYEQIARGCLSAGAGPYENARTLIHLADYGIRTGNLTAAENDLSAARAIANRYSYAQEQFEVEALLNKLDMQHRKGAFTKNTQRSRGPLTVSDQSIGILVRLREFDGQHLAVGAEAD